MNFAISSKSLSIFTLKEIFQLALRKFFKRKTLHTENLYKYKLLVDKIILDGYQIDNKKRGFIISKVDSYKFFVRKYSSDLKVFEQVWINEEYKAVISCLKKNSISVINIIDCGANVGYTSLYFTMHFPEAKIVCIEPDKGNIDIIKNNLALNQLKNIYCVNKAVWNKPAFLRISKDFRDGENWSLFIEETTNKVLADVESVSIEEIILKYNMDSVDILKIDIEGAERHLFQDYKTIDFLVKTKCLAIEIHDEFKIRKQIYKILKNTAFDLIESGELTIAIKN